jgi:glutamate racemase
VVACNTATAAAVAMLREQYQLPIIGMEPAVKPAAAATKSGVIGVLATSGTLKSAQFAALLEHYGQGLEVVTQACIGLVEYIERGELHNASTKALIQQYCQPLLLAGADTIVLGCTHYPFVRGLIEEIIKETTDEKITLIDTGAAVARHLKHCLQESNLLAESTSTGDVKFWTNNQANDAEQVINMLWGEKAEIVKKVSD